MVIVDQQRIWSCIYLMFHPYSDEWEQKDQIKVFPINSKLQKININGKKVKLPRNSKKLEDEGRCHSHQNMKSKWLIMNFTLMTTVLLIMCVCAKSAVCSTPILPFSFYAQY